MKQNKIQDSTVPTLNSYAYENLFNVYEEDGYYYYNLLKNIKLPDDLGPSFYSLTRPYPGELLPQISYRVYKEVNLWWAIALANNINNPLEKLNPETPLKILTPSLINNIISTIRDV
jgi:hypothetical protein